MPELGAAEVETLSPSPVDGSIPGRLSVTGEATFIPQLPLSDWFPAGVPPQPPAQIVRTTEYPLMLGEVSRTTILTQAGISMTVIVADADARDLGRDTNWIGQGCVRFHVLTNGVTPALHYQRMVSLELGNDYPNIYQEVVNLMVREVQELVLVDRQRAEAVRQRQMLEAEQRMRTVFSVPDAQIGISIDTAPTYNYIVNNVVVNTNTPGTIYFAPGNYVIQDSVFVNNTIHLAPNTTLTGMWNTTFAGTVNSLTFNPLTPEQQEERKVQQEAEAKALADANKRAEQLLLDLLGEMGFARYKRKGYVLVMSRTKPGTVYRVRGMAGIDLYERNKRGKIISLDKYLCIHPRDPYPEADTIAAQVMLCRHDEDTLWKTANIHKRSGSGIAVNGYQIAGNFAA